MLLLLLLLSEGTTDCPQTAPYQRPPDLLVTEVMLEVRPGAVHWVNLHVDVAERTDRSEVARAEVSHLQLAHWDHRGMVELSWLHMMMMELSWLHMMMMERSWLHLIY